MLFELGGGAADVYLATTPAPVGAAGCSLGPNTPSCCSGSRGAAKSKSVSLHCAKQAQLAVLPGSVATRLRAYISAHSRRCVTSQQHFGVFFFFL